MFPTAGQKPGIEERKRRGAVYYSGSVVLLGALSESYEKFHAYECTRNFRCTVFHDVFGIKAEEQQERKREETYWDR